MLRSSLQPDGKLVAAASTAGGILILRHLSDGSPDGSFGVAGRTRIAVQDNWLRVADLALQSDGRIVLAGNYESDLDYSDALLARLMPSGEPDATFATGGVRLTDAFDRWGGYAVRLLLQLDGKAVVAGFGYDGTPNGYNFAVMRFEMTGEVPPPSPTPTAPVAGDLDPTFAQDGEAPLPLPELTPADSALQSDGRLVVGRSGTEPQAFVLNRLTLNGDLDRTFGQSGVSTTYFADAAELLDITILADDRVVAVGYTSVSEQEHFALARYGRDGALDSAFGEWGRVVTPIGNGYARAQAVAVLPDGKIVVAGTITRSVTGDTDLALARYLPDGTLDTTFSEDGKLVVEQTDTKQRGLYVVAQPDGKVLVAGRSTTQSGMSTDDQFLLARFNLDGTPDPTFDGDGWVFRNLYTPPVAEDAEGPTKLLLQADGRIVVVGYASLFETNQYPVVLFRYLPSGQPDPTFGDQGTVLLNLDPPMRAYDAVFEPDGKIVVAGDSRLVRFLANGTLDSTFGTGGIVQIRVSTGYPKRLHRLGNGKFLVLTAGSGVSSPSVVLRYHATGAQDLTFGEDGWVRLLSSSNDPHLILAQPDDKLVIASTMSYGSGYVWRLTAEGLPDLTFGTNGYGFVTVFPSNTGFGVSALANGSDGKILLGGYKTGTNPTFMVARLLPSGTLDPSFGDGGIVLTNSPTVSAGITDLAVQADGKIVAAGSRSNSSTDGDTVLLRYLPDGTPDPTFGTAGIVVHDAGGTIGRLL